MDIFVVTIENRTLGYFASLALARTYVGVYYQHYVLSAEYDEIFPCEIYSSCQGYDIKISKISVVTE